MFDLTTSQHLDIGAYLGGNCFVSFSVKFLLDCQNSLLYCAQRCIGTANHRVVGGLHARHQIGRRPWAIPATRTTLAPVDWLIKISILEVTLGVHSCKYIGEIVNGRLRALTNLKGMATLPTSKVTFPTINNRIGDTTVAPAKGDVRLAANQHAFIDPMIGYHSEML